MSVMTATVYLRKEIALPFRVQPTLAELREMTEVAACIFAPDMTKENCLDELFRQGNRVEKEEIWEDSFSTHFYKKDTRSRSLSVGDVITLQYGNESWSYVRDVVGWIPLVVHRGEEK